MKKRVLLILIIIGLLILLTPIVFVFFRTQGRSRFGAISLLVVFYLAIYAFFGISKTIIYLIYGLITFGLLIIFPDYEFPFILIGTLLMIINPLEHFERYLNKQLNENAFVPIQLTFVSKYNTYLSYRRDMKSALNLPQMQKLFTNQKYKHLRQATFVIITGITIFVFISQISTMVRTLEQFKVVSFFTSSYAITVLIIINMLLYRKGFTVAFRVSIVLLFPPTIFLIAFSNLPDMSKWILNISTVILFGYFSFREIIYYYQRVIYEAYQYYDHDFQAEVYANALFEPYVYNEKYVEEYVYKLDITRQKFDKIFQNILIYANYRRFFIVAYTINQNGIKLYVHFKSNQYKKTLKFITYLESLINQKVSYETFYDPGKNRYEQQFFHKDDFIVARTLYLVDILKTLEIKNQLVINLFVYFSKKADLHGFMEKYPVIRLHDYDYESNRAVLVQLETTNTEHLIEVAIRSFLLNLLVYQGKFVRVSVEYKS